LYLVGQIGRLCDAPTGGGALNAGEKFHLRGLAAAAVMAHPVDDGAERQVTPGHVNFVDQLHLPAALAFDAQEPRREGP
jgi:hypothetical protein